MIKHPSAVTSLLFLGDLLLSGDATGGLCVSDREVVMDQRRDLSSAVVAFFTSGGSSAVVFVQFADSTVVAYRLQGSGRGRRGGLQLLGSISTQVGTCNDVVVTTFYRRGGDSRLFHFSTSPERWCE